MNKTIFILIIVLFSSCKTKTIYVYDKYGGVIPIYRPNYQKTPKNEEYKIVDFFFSKWAETSNEITEDEFSKLDTLEKDAYLTYEKLFLDTLFIGFNPQKTAPKYLLIPNSIYVGIADSIYVKYDFIHFDNIRGKRINNFRPRVSTENAKILYYTKEYKKQLPIIADKLGVGSFIHLSGFLMSGYPTFLETSPLITSIIYNSSVKNEACITYQIGNDTYQTLIKKVNYRWIKIRDLTVMTRD